MKPVLCVRNDRDDTLGITAGVLAQNKIDVVTVDAFAPTASWPALEAISGVIAFGGAMNVDEVEQHPYLLTQRRLLHDALDAGLPVLGICLGAQLLARTLGAPVRPAPVRELGFKPITLTADGKRDRLLRVFDDGDCVFQWHEDTFEVSANTVGLALGDEVPNQAFRYGSSAWGVQFHFEVDEAGVERWLRAAEPTLKPVWKTTADQVRGEMARHLARQQVKGQHVFSAFAEVVTEAARTT